MSLTSYIYVHSCTFHTFVSRSFHLQLPKEIIVLLCQKQQHIQQCTHTTLGIELGGYYTSALTMVNIGTYAMWSNSRVTMTYTHTHVARHVEECWELAL